MGRCGPSGPGRSSRNLVSARDGVRHRTRSDGRTVWQHAGRRPGLDASIRNGRPRSRWRHRARGGCGEWQHSVRRLSDVFRGDRRGRGRSARANRGGGGPQGRSQLGPISGPASVGFGRTAQEGVRPVSARMHAKTASLAPDAFSCARVPQGRRPPERKAGPGCLISPEPRRQRVLMHTASMHLYRHRYTRPSVESIKISGFVADNPP